MKAKLFITLTILVLVCLPEVAKTQTPGSLGSEDHIVGIVGKETITERDIRLALPNYDTALSSLSPPQKVQIMRQIITQKILAAEGRKLELDKSSAFEARKKSLFDAALARQTVEHFVKNAGKIDQTRVKSFYDENMRLYRDDKVRASHILLKTKEEAETVLGRLKTGENFAKLAKEKSIGPSSIKGGDLGFFKRGQMVPAFDKAAFSLAKNEIGGPIRTPYGFHLIKVTEIRKGEITPYKEVESKILKQMVAKKLEAYIQDLRKTVKIVIKDPRFAISGE